MTEIYDPQWLRRSYRACLWDGGHRAPGAEFCSTACVDAYAAWDLAQRVRDDEADLVEEPTARDRPGVRQSETPAAEITLSMRSRTSHSPSTALRRPNSSARAAPM
jgi:hypothetical protein